MLSSTARWDIFLQPTDRPLINQFIHLINQHSGYKISVNDLGNHEFFYRLSDEEPPKYLINIGDQIQAIFAEVARLLAQKQIDANLIKLALFAFLPAITSILPASADTIKQAIYNLDLAPYLNDIIAANLHFIVHAKSQFNSPTPAATNFVLKTKISEMIIKILGQDTESNIDKYYYLLRECVIGKGVGKVNIDGQEVDQISVNAAANTITFVEDEKIKSTILPAKFKKTIIDKLSIPVSQEKMFARDRAYRARQLSPESLRRNEANKAHWRNAINEALTYTGTMEEYRAQLSANTRAKLEEIKEKLLRLSDEQLLVMKAKVPPHNQDLKDLFEQEENRRNSHMQLKLR